MIIAESFIKQFGKGVPSRKGNKTTMISPHPGKANMHSYIANEKGMNSSGEFSIDGNSPSVLNLNEQNPKLLNHL